MSSLVRALLPAVLFSAAVQAQPSFSGTGYLANDFADSAAFSISGDGRVAVGYHSPMDGQSAFRWTQPTGLISLGMAVEGDVESSATGASFDGSFICGDAGKLRGHDALRWDAVNGMVSLGNLRGVARFFGNGSAHGISDNGLVVVGFSDNTDFNAEAFRWVDSGVGTPTGAMTGLGDLPGGRTESIAWGVSGDGNTVVGQSSSVSGDVAFIWTQATGMVDLGALELVPDIGYGSLAADASFDGSIIVGWSLLTSDSDPSGFSSVAVRWTSGGSITSLGDLPGGRVYSLANAVNADGSVIVGQGTSDSAPDSAGLEAFYWSTNTGMISIQSTLARLGVDLNGWTLVSATGVSADGRTIAGFGLHNGLSEGWVATLPVFCAADFNVSGAVTVQDIFDFLAAYFGNDLRADFNRSGAITVQDIFDFLAAYFSACP